MIFLFFLALILFGPRRLPEIGRQIGRIMNEFRRASNEFRSQIEAEINTLDVKNTPQILPRLKEPLGSLASRIFNPPAPEQTQTAEGRAAETKPAIAVPENRSGEEGPLASPAGAPAAPSPVTSSPVTPSKVAPDA